MGVVFNLPKFGPAEFAVGRLLDGDLPDDDEERWRLLSAPQERIQALLDDHLRAQAALRVCRDSGQPFALFLRTFSAEYSATRDGKQIVKGYTWYSARLQEWIADLLVPKGIPLVKLHGESDSLSADLSGGGHALSTNGANWAPVAAELIRASSVTILLITHATPGVVLELELIRKFGRTDRCLVAIAAPQFDPEFIKLVSSGAGIHAQDAARQENASADLTGFANVVELHSPAEGAEKSYPDDLKQGIMRLISGARTQALLDRAVTVEFSYLEHDFADSDDFAVVERQLWDQLRLLRIVFDDTCWSALRAHGIEFHCFSYEHLWIEVHRMYALAIQTADFRALAEILSYLLPFTVYRDADFALLIPVLAGEYEQLGRQLFPAGPPDNEQRYATVTDLSKLPAEISVAASIAQAARTSQSQDLARAVCYYQAAVICALRATDSDSKFRSAIIGDITQTWARGLEKAGMSDWALANFSFALKLFRDLAAADREQYTEPFPSCLCLADLQYVDGLGEFPGTPGAAAELTQDPPGLELGVRALTG
jgi:hypothetical protein